MMEKSLNPYIGVHYTNTPVIEDRVTYDVREKLVKTGDSPYDFITEQEVYVKEKVSTDAYIQSFKDDAGLEELLSKVAKSGDISLLNQKQGVYGDIRDFPDNNMDLDEALAKGKAAAKEANIPFTQEALEKWIEAKIAEKVSAEQEGGAE